MTIDKADVIAALRAEDVARHLGIVGQWRGRWLRSTRCGAADHSSEAFGLARDGMWHCWACDRGGDLLALIATSESLDLRADFGKVLALAAQIAGLDGEPEFGGGYVKPPPKPRPELPAQPPLPTRIANAKRRAAWVWERLYRWEEVAIDHGGARRSVGDLYLQTRRLDPAAIRKREDIRETPVRCTLEQTIKHPDLKSLAFSFATPGIALPVRSVDDGMLVDIRVRRYEPREHQPKIIGMLGGVTSASEQGRPRQLIGCYGHPEHIDADLVVIVEGALDYLSGLYIWPDAAVLGAVEAGSLALVTAHAARQLAARGGDGRMIIVEQSDPPRTLRDGRVVPGAADESINEGPNSAAKVAERILGPHRVGWLPCEGDAVKDLNDLVRREGLDAHVFTGRVRWWNDEGAR